MKLTELEKGKAYFVYNRNHWIDAGYGESYYKVASNLRRNKYTLELSEDGNIRRDSAGRIWMTNGTRSERVVLKAIRAEFFEAVALITNNNRNKSNRWYDRGIKYEQHLKRKADRQRNEIEKPIREAFFASLKTAGAEHIWSETKLTHLPIEVMQKITNALANN